MRTWRRRNRLLGSRSVSKSNAVVAPFESCVSCFRGDVTTAAVVEGDADYYIATLSKLASIPLDEAEATVQNMFEEQGSPSGRFTCAMRLCRDCAEQTGATVVELKALDEGRPVAAYRQIGYAKVASTDTLARLNAIAAEQGAVG